MIPADTIAEITTAIASLQLESNIATQILAAVLAPLLRSAGEHDAPASVSPSRPRRRSRSKPRKSLPQKRKYTRRHLGPSEPRQRAIEALKKAGPGATPTEIAKSIGVSRGTVVNAGKELAKEERRQARKAVRETTKPVPTDKRIRAQNFLKDELSDGPKRVSDIEEQAAKSHVDPRALEQARADLGVIASRSNAGGVQAVQWSLPG